MNHCLLEVEVLEAPQVRYTQDNQTPVAEMVVRFDGLRPEDPPGQLKVVGWGNLAQDLQNRIQPGQRLVLEGRMRISTVTRQDGMKEKKAEFTLARLHPLSPGSATPAGPGDRLPPPPPPPPAGATAPSRSIPAPSRAPRPVPAAAAPATAPQEWNTSPLVPDEMTDGDDEIPF
ncbi:MAG TPA: single-stranded DNA-binding protein [Cyanobium sp.]|nr:single-stranded DNA-binding protein [Cyanobium sp.]